MNAYEEARERLERASQMHREMRVAMGQMEHTQALIETEWAAAMRNLRQYETTPGVPLPQYREELSA